MIRRLLFLGCAGNVALAAWSVVSPDWPMITYVVPGVLAVVMFAMWLRCA